MGDVTSPDQLPYPFDSDTPDIPRDIKGLADATQAALLKGVPIFASPGDRDGNIPSPAAGMLCYVTDMAQYQGYSTQEASWLPVAGKMPYGSIADSSDVSIQTRTKLPFNSGNEVVTTGGGVSWNSGLQAFQGPAGLYLVALRVMVESASGDSGIEMGFGNNVQMGSAYGGGFIGAGIESWMSTTGERAMSATGDFAAWVYDRYGRDRYVSYARFSLRYLSWRYGS